MRAQKPHPVDDLLAKVCAFYLFGGVATAIVEDSLVPLLACGGAMIAAATVTNWFKRH